MIKTKFILSQTYVIVDHVEVLQFYCSEFVYLIWLSNLLTMNVPGEGYSRNT